MSRYADQLVKKLEEKTLDESIDIKQWDIHNIFKISHISIFHKGIIWFCPSLGSWLHTVWMLWPVHRSVLRRIPSTIQMILWLHISRRLWTSDFGLFLYWVCTQTCLPDYHNYNCFFKLPERNLSQQKRQLTSFCLLDSGFTFWCSSDETFKNWLHGYGKYWFLLQHHQEI